MGAVGMQGMGPQTQLGYCSLQWPLIYNVCRQVRSRFGFVGMAGSRPLLCQQLCFQLSEVPWVLRCW